MMRSPEHTTPPPQEHETPASLPTAPLTPGERVVVKDFGVADHTRPLPTEVQEFYANNLGHDVHIPADAQECAALVVGSDIEDPDTYVSVLDVSSDPVHLPEYGKSPRPDVENRIAAYSRFVAVTWSRQGNDHVPTGYFPLAPNSGSDMAVDLQKDGRRLAYVGIDIQKRLYAERAKPRGEFDPVDTETPVRFVGQHDPDIYMAQPPLDARPIIRIQLIPGVIEGTRHDDWYNDSDEQDTPPQPSELIPGVQVAEVDAATGTTQTRVQQRPTYGSSTRDRRYDDRPRYRQRELPRR